MVRGVSVEECLLGDAGFAASTKMLTPIDMNRTGGAILMMKQAEYNSRISKARVRVENAIGAVKCRWPLVRM